MKKALIVATVGSFVASFEKNDMLLLKNMGYEVHFAANTHLNKRKDETQVLIDEYGLCVHHIDFARSPFSLSNVKAFFQLKHLMKKEKYDVVHCHTPMGGVLGRIAAHILGVNKIIYTAHGFHFYKGAPKFNWLIFYNVEKFLSRWTTALITINSYDYDIAKKKFYTPNIYRIHGVGVNEDLFTASSHSRESIRKKLGVKDSEIMLLSVGELNRQKNQNLIIRAVKRLVEEDNYKIKYFVAGEGQGRAITEEIINSLGLNKHVRLLGYRKDIKALLSAADFFIFPSYREGLSVALMEAIAAQKVILCSKIRGNVDLVLSELSLFDPSSVDSFVEHLKKLVYRDNKDLIQQNLTNLEAYKLSNVSREMQRIYQRILLDNES